ncbi:hypothetical protein D1818_23775 [Aquimarina sp. BL5]|nr:hypothetical protein D1818_23775 [Aquimarina sp. BL5]RKN01821.1 hypothetical protein D7036_17265 [Aquimarina sp. BL5]
MKLFKVFLNPGICNKNIRVYHFRPLNIFYDLKKSFNVSTFFIFDSPAKTSNNPDSYWENKLSQSKKQFILKFL